MSQQSILTILEKDVPAAGLKPLVEAAGEGGFHLNVLVAGTSPEPPVYSMAAPSYGAYSVPDDWIRQVEEEGKSVAAKVGEVQTLLQQEGISASAESVFCYSGQLQDSIARHAKICDRVLLSTDLMPTQTMFKDALFGVLFKSPVAAIVHSGEVNACLNPKRVFIAWNTGLEASRAVHAALPLLQQAEEVIVGVFDPVMTSGADGEDPGADVSAWLSRHGCKVDLKQYPGGGNTVGECIEKRATETGVDLVVMGAYGHTRLRQRIFGGTTRYMLEQKNLPVFLAH